MRPQHVMNPSTATARSLKTVGQTHRGSRAAGAEREHSHTLSCEMVLGNAEITKVKEKATVQRRLYLTQLLINTMQLKHIILSF